MMYSVLMLRMNIYIPEDLNKKLYFIARSKKKAKAEVVREALAIGLRTIQPKSKTAQALITLAKKAQQIPTKGKVPKDFIRNLDYYTWGGEKRE